MDVPSLSPTTARFVVVAPTFNHAALAVPVLEELSRREHLVIVIDDGSTDVTSSALQAWALADPVRRVVITHETNQGKASALRSGFREAVRLGFTHAATIDTDGQHEPADVARLIEIACAHPDAIVIGARSRRTPGYTLGGRIGRALSNHFIWLIGGVRVGDSQSGMRVYPLGVVDRLGARAQRYAFETEVLTRAGWAGVPVIETPIACTYQIVGGRVSHFKVGRDTRSAIAMHVLMLLRSLLPGKPVPRCAPVSQSGTGTMFQRACHWFSPRRLVRLARGDTQDRERLAASVGTGLFMASVPLYGVKTVLCLWLSARFRLHPAAVIGVSSLCTPPLGFAFILMSVLVGHLMLHGTMLSVATLPGWRDVTFTTMGSVLLEWVLGSLVVGALLGSLGYWLTRWSLSRAGQSAAEPGASHDIGGESAAPDAACTKPVTP